MHNLHYIINYTKKPFVLFLLENFIFPPKFQYNFLTMSDNIFKKSSFKKNVSKDNNDEGKRNLVHSSTKVYLIIG